MLLGNRQLLSGLFVIALLLGVAFARGYIVGRKSLPSPHRRSAVPSPPAGVTEPQPGTYWQVKVIAPAQAELSRSCSEIKGFRVSLSPGTRNLTRVLVGPYRDRESLGRAKSSLQGSGFHQVIVKRE